MNSDWKDMRKNMPIGNQFSFEVIKAKLLNTDYLVRTIGGGVSLFVLSFQPTIYIITVHPGRVPVLAICSRRPKTEKIWYVSHTSLPPAPTADISDASRQISGTSLVVQWLRVCLPMQGTRV